MGAEPTLKNEMSRAHPGFRFAFSRPGFLTFKTDQPLSPVFEPGLVFARTSGVSLGKVAGVEPGLACNDDNSRAAEVLRLARAVIPEPHPGAENSEKLRLHVWERDRYEPGEEPLGFVHGKLGAQAVTALKAVSGAADGTLPLFHEDPAARTGDWVFDVIVIEFNEWWVGFHQHTAGHSPWPGAKPPLEMPPDSPSRAWLKLEESLLWSGVPIRAGDRAVELGSAPGGAAFALLNRGVRVAGVDPGEMAPTVLKHPLFRHFQHTAAEIMRRDLPENVQWLFNDMNVEPRVSMFAVDKLASRMADSLLGVVLTVKLNRWSMADEIPSWLDHLRAMGMMKVRARQLFHNRQEVCLYGVTRKGLLRK